MDLGQVELGGVVETVAGYIRQKERRVEALRGALFELGERLRLCGFQRAVEASKYGERQDDLTVIRLFEVAAQQVGNGPYKGREICGGLIAGGH